MICGQFHVTGNHKKILFNFTPQACCCIFKQRKLCKCVCVACGCRDTSICFWTVPIKVILMQLSGPWMYQQHKQRSTDNMRGKSREKKRAREQNTEKGFMFPCYTSDSLSLLQIFAGFSHVPQKAVRFWLPATRWGFSLLDIYVKRVPGLSQTAGLVVIVLCQGDGRARWKACNLKKIFLELGNKNRRHLRLMTMHF